MWAIHVHYVGYTCTLCGLYMYTMWAIHVHVHYVGYTCTLCGLYMYMYTMWAIHVHVHYVGYTCDDNACMTMERAWSCLRAKVI